MEFLRKNALSPQSFATPGVSCRADRDESVRFVAGCPSRPFRSRSEMRKRASPGAVPDTGTPPMISNRTQTTSPGEQPALTATSRFRNTEWSIGQLLGVAPRGSPPLSTLRPTATPLLSRRAPILATQIPASRSRASLNAMTLENSRPSLEGANVETRWRASQKRIFRMTWSHR